MYSLSIIILTPTWKIGITQNVQPLEMNLFMADCKLNTKYSILKKLSILLLEFMEEFILTKE